MRGLAKLGLWVLGTAVPVFIAACYGIAYRFNRAGHVVDRQSGAGIAGIEVACLQGETETDIAYSSEDGSFSLNFDEPCESVRATDVDGDMNGGAYQSTTVPLPEPEETFVIEMDH